MLSNLIELRSNFEKTFLSHKKEFQEIVFIYFLLPLAGFLLIKILKVPAILLLFPLFALFCILLTRDKNFSWQSIALSSEDKKEFRNNLASIIQTFLTLSPFLFLLAYLYTPETFLEIPRERPELWVKIMFFYPLISVTSQEIIYRVYFYHRYQSFVEQAPTTAIIINALIFSIGHLIYIHWLTFLISFLGGLLFAWRYQQTKSFWLVHIEHSLYGLIIFTSGLGIFFFSGRVT